MSSPLDDLRAIGRIADEQTRAVHGKDGACNEAYAECICWLEPSHDGPHTCSRGGCYGQWTGTIGEQKPVRFPMGRVVPV